MRIRSEMFGISLALAAATSSAPAFAQSVDTTLAQVAGQIDGRRLSPYTHAWQSYREGPDGTLSKLAIWYDTLSVVERDGLKLLRRVQHIVRDNAPTTVLVNEADRVTLLPHRTTAGLEARDPFIDLRFAGRRVSGRRPLLPHNGNAADLLPVELTLELPQPTHDWRWWGLLAAALPLDTGYKGRFLAIATEGNLSAPLVIVEVRVVGEALVGRVPCWVVDLKAGVPWTLWIAKAPDVPPVQRIRIEQTVGGTVIWDPLPAP